MSTRTIALMLGPSYSSLGGIASVIEVYRAHGFMKTWNVTFVPTYVEGKRIAKLFTAIKAIIATLRLFVFSNVSVVHIHTAQRTSVYRKSIFVALSLLFGHPYLFHLHGSTFDEFYVEECGPLRKALVRWIFRNAHYVITLTSAWRDWVRWAEPNATVAVVHNPVQIPDTPVSIKESAEPEILNLVFLGRLGQRKGIYDLLNALVEVRKTFPNFQLFCGGDGELALVSARARELGIQDHVKILGWISGTDKAKLLSLASIYILPSYHEGLPMGVLEAMAASVPVIMTDIGGISDAIDDGVNGFLIDPGDIRQLSMLILRLANDPGLRQSIGDAARKKAESTFSTQVVFERLGELYAKVGAARCTLLGCNS